MAYAHCLGYFQKWLCYVSNQKGDRRQPGKGDKDTGACEGRTTLSRAFDRVENSDADLRATAVSSHQQYS